MNGCKTTRNTPNSLVNNLSVESTVQNIQNKKDLQDVQKHFPLPFSPSSQKPIA